MIFWIYTRLSNLTIRYPRGFYRVYGVISETLVYFLNKWQKSNWMKTEMAIFCYVQKKIRSQNNFSQIFFKSNFLNAMQKVKRNWIALHFLRSSYQKVVFCRWGPQAFSECWIVCYPSERILMFVEGSCSFVIGLFILCKSRKSMWVKEMKL